MHNLGSVFALGGIGSASVVLALRSTMENLISGLVLKLQDKIRVGEIVTVPGGDSKHSGKIRLKYQLKGSCRKLQCTSYFTVV